MKVQWRPFGWETSKERKQNDNLLKTVHKTLQMINYHCFIHLTHMYQHRAEHKLQVVCVVF